MDRYLISIGHWNFPRLKLPVLATTVLILAAKMEEKFAPSIEFTLEYLTDEEKEIVNKRAIYDLEA